MKIRSLFLSLLAAGILSAQPAQPTQGAPHHKMMQNLTADLNLTAHQQTQIRAIFNDQAAHSKDLRQKLHDQHTALAAAVKRGANNHIDKIAQDMAPLQGQMTAAPAKRLANV